MERVPLWRKCRVLANRVRLKMLCLLKQRPGLRVSDVARAMKVSLPTASQYLRALEACGFVAARRIRRSVVYHVSNHHADRRRPDLAKALMMRLGRERNSIDAVYRSATTFANPGRIQVFRTLTKGAKSVAQLTHATGWAGWTVLRHLHKLENRGFVRRHARAGKYEIVKPNDDFGRVLADSAAEDIT